jgi:ligand-binding sensor domain-containing protein
VEDEWKVFNPGNSSLPNQRVLSVAQDQKGIYWFGTASGLASYDGTKWTVYRASDFGLNSEQINAIAVDDQNRIWIGTLDGVAVFDGVGWKPFTKESSGLVDNAVFSIAVQQSVGEPLIWFGTLSGISRLETTTGQWESYSSQVIDTGWGGVSDLFFDSTGKLWVCTEGGGISLWDGKVWTRIRVSNSRLPYSTIETIDELEPGVFWIAASIPNSSGGVLARFNGTNWRTYEKGLSGYSGAETVTIAKDNKGRYWFGTRTDGIDLFVP